MYYVSAPSYKRAHIAMHYLFNAGNVNWIQSTNHHLNNLQPNSNGNYHEPITHTKTITLTTTH
jgi:hypothetical protein